MNEVELANRMGIRITDKNRDRLIGTMPVAGNRQPQGLLHGGASAVLAETLGTVAANLHAADTQRIAVGVELSCTHHRPALDGVVTGTVTPAHLGSTLSTFDIVIADAAERRVCTARLTCAIVRKEER